MTEPPLSIEAVNGMSQVRFAQALGSVFENSPWVAERAWDRRPFDSVDELHDVMMAVVAGAPAKELIAFLGAHPDLAGKAARAGAMTAESVGEQASAGLDQLSDEEYARFGRLNAAYRETFGFPFIIAVKNHTKESILAAFEERVAHTRDEEIECALGEIGAISRLRLDALMAETADA